MDIDGDKIVYTLCDSETNTCQIMLYNIQTSTEYHVGTGSSTPRISGNNVIFASNDSGTRVLQLVDVSDPASPKTTELIRNIVVNPWGSYDISGDNITYVTSPPPTSYIYNIRSGSSQTVFSGAGFSNVLIYGNTVTFITGTKDYHFYRDAPYVCTF
jgi:hypothetical protein